MKKLVCLLSVLLFAGVSFAQSTTSKATVTQYGSNIGEIYQVGTGDNAVITLGSSASPVTNNHKQSYSTDWIEGAFISQTVSNDNTAEITITGSHTSASIDQQGGGNEAYMSINTMYTRTTNWDRMGADINQIGYDNYASQTTVAHFGTYGIQGILIDQQGNNNSATQYSFGGRGSTMEIFQNGNNNKDNVDVSKTTLNNPLALDWHYKPIDGVYTQYQAGEYSVAHISVEGNDNQTAQYQEYTKYGEGFDGRNSVTLDIAGNSNHVAQAQLGENNIIDVDINGGANIVGTSQLGNVNIINVEIIGSNNTAGVEQVGNGFTKGGDVYQNGSNNFAKIVQN